MARQEELDRLLAERLQREEQTAYLKQAPSVADLEKDRLLAEQLQKEEQEEYRTEYVTQKNEKSPEKVFGYKSLMSEHRQLSLVDPQWEVIDPTPDIFTLFQVFDDSFFWGKLKMCEVRWSPRMTVCAGVCCYQTGSGFCSIRLSKPLLTLRPRKDLVETLLHEMIHAFLFVTQNNRDRDGHGPEFHKHMHRINGQTGTKISVYHSFHDEVRHFKVHWWRCDGPCRDKAPFLGWVKRSMNRAPSKNDFWWPEHERTCGGKYVKVKGPEMGEKAIDPKNKRKQPPEIGVSPLRKLFKTTSLMSPTGMSKAATKTGLGSKSKVVTINGNVGVDHGPVTPAAGPSGFVAFTGSGRTLGSSSVAGNKPLNRSPSGAVNLPVPGQYRQKTLNESFQKGSDKKSFTKSVRILKVLEVFSSDEDEVPSEGLTSNQPGPSWASDEPIVISVDSRLEMVKCPVCCTDVCQSTINDHIDICLS